MRAVGHANGSNPISVVVPCHRLIGASGSLVKYGGGLERKRWLLRARGRGDIERRSRRANKGTFSAVMSATGSAGWAPDDRLRRTIR